MDYTTWHDQKPTHRARITPRLRELLRESAAAIEAHDKAVDAYLAQTKTDPLAAEIMRRLGAEVTRLDTEIRAERQWILDNPREADLLIDAAEQAKDEADMRRGM